MRLGRPGVSCHCPEGRNRKNAKPQIAGSQDRRIAGSSFRVKDRFRGSVSTISSSNRIKGVWRREGAMGFMRRREKEVFVRRVISGFVGAMCVATGLATVLAAGPGMAATPSGPSPRGAFFPAREASFRVDATTAPVAAPDVTVDMKSAVNPVFYDRSLMVNQYGIGILSGMLAGTIGFYIGNAFEGGIFGSRSHKGYLGFTGIRYEHKRGPFWGGGAGLLVGSSLAVFFVGDMDEEQGSVWWTLAGGAVTSAAAFALADMAGVQEKRGMLPFLPLLALPPVGAVGGYHVSRWFNDKKRHRITEGTAAAGNAPGGATLHAPRLGFMPGTDGTVVRLDALNLTF